MAENISATMIPHHGRPLFAAYAVPIATAIVTVKMERYHHALREGH